MYFCVYWLEKYYKKQKYTVMTSEWRQEQIKAFQIVT